MPYTPSTTTSTLVVSLGYAFQGSFTAGSPNLASVGFVLKSSDVGNVIMVLSGPPDGLTHVTWTTVKTFTDASHVVLNASIPDNSTAIVNVILYRPVPYGAAGVPNSIQTGSLEVDLSLTSDSTARFVHESLDGSTILKVGMPVLITDTEVSVEYFGGTIDQVQTANVPGASVIFCDCQCVSWNLLCRRRTTGVSDAIAEGDTTLGAANPSGGQFINVRPDQIITYYVTHAMFDDGVTTNLDTSGPQLPTFSSIGAKISDALDQLVSAATPTGGTPQFQWFMDPRRVLNFIKQGSLTAPWNISDVDLSDQNVLIQVQNTISRQNYFNRGLAEITQVSQTFLGDGSSTSFTLAQPIPATALGQVTITLNGGQQTVGVAGVDLGKNWYYSIGSTTINQVGSATNWANNVAYNFNDTVNRSGTLYVSLSGGNKNNDPATSPTFWKPWGTAGPLQPTDVLVVSYSVDVIYAYDALAAQSAQTVVESGSGIWEQKINLNALNSVVDAESFVTSMVLQAKDFSQQIQIQTYKPGLNIGQTIQVNLSFIGINSMGSPALGNYFIIDTLKIGTADNRKLFTVTASIDAPIVGGWTTQLKRGLGTAGGVNAHPLAVPFSATGFASGAGAGAPGGGPGGPGGGGGGGGISGGSKQIGEANLIPVRTWIDESGRQPILTAMNNTETVPIRYNGYLFFAAACNDGTFQVFKSTDHGRTWAAVDAAHAPADLSSPQLSGMSGSCVYDGGYLLHCATVQPNANKTLSLQSFNLATETWGVARTGGPTAQLICTLHWRPNNHTVLITYDRGAVDPSPTRSRFWGVSYDLAALAYGTAFDIGAQLLTQSSNVTGDVNSTFATGITDASGRTHFLLSNKAATYFWYQAVELGDTRGSHYFFAFPGGGKIPTWTTNSNLVISTSPAGVQRLTAVIVTFE